MAATIEVFIQGIGICYQKQVGTEKVWRILFRIDPPCHSVKFSTQAVPSGEKIDRGSLGTANGRFEVVTVPNGIASSSTEATTIFKNQVFNFTKQGETHRRIEKKQGAEPLSTLLTIEDMSLNVDKPLVLDPAPGQGPLELVLTHRGRKVKTLGTIAYSIVGTIKLRDRGSIIVNEIRRRGNGEEERVEIFRTRADESHKLFFDNDCERTMGATGDMHKLYNMFKDKDSDDSQEQFLVESRRIVLDVENSIGGESPEVENSKGGESSENDKLQPIDELGRTGQHLSFHGDKPCLIAQVTEADDLE
jgi:hypothetical protein